MKQGNLDLLTDKQIGYQEKWAERWPEVIGHTDEVKAGVAFHRRWLAEGKPRRWFRYPIHKPTTFWAGLVYSVRVMLARARIRLSIADYPGERWPL